MKVTLNHHTPLIICADAIRTCWQSQESSDTDRIPPFFMEDEEGIYKAPPNFKITCGEKDRALIDRVGNKNKHASTLEHLTYSFYIEGISRALLQEFARHRMASLSVKSTRYTLKELKEEEPFYNAGLLLEHLKGTEFEECTMDDDRAEKYLVYTGNASVDFASLLALENLRAILVAGISNDRAKYCLPESYKTELTWTINARSLQNFLYLRTDKAALWEIRDLATAVYEALPADHQYLFDGYLKIGEES